MILFTGLTGTSGSALVDVLSREHYSEHFRVIVRPTSNLKKLKNSGLDYDLLFGSIDDPVFLKDAMDGITTVFHIAAKLKLATIAKAVTESNSVKHCIFVSSTSIYSKSHEISDNLISAEENMKASFNARGIAWTIIRPTMIFGSLNDHNISVFMGWLDKHHFFPIVKNGSALLQPVSRLDMAEAYYLILCNRDLAKYKEYVVSGEKPMSLKQTLQEISHSINKSTVLINVPYVIAQLLVKLVYCITLGHIDYREQLYRLTEDRAFSHELIEDELGYSPESFESRVAVVAEEYKVSKRKN